MTQRVDEVARAVRQIPVSDPSYLSVVQETLGDTMSRDLIESIARAAMRAVVKQMREHWAAKEDCIVGGYIRSFLDAYAKEADLEP